MVRLPDGTRSPYCGKACQNLGGGVSTPIRTIPPIPLQPPQPYRPVTYTMMAPPPPLNQPNPSIGMGIPSMPPLLPGGNARPIGTMGTMGTMGSPWVMAKMPFCRYCNVKPCWKDQNHSYSSYCSRTCKEAAESLYSIYIIIIGFY